MKAKGCDVSVKVQATEKCENSPNIYACNLDSLYT